MKIAFIVGNFPVLSETFILNQITGLIDRGHEVDIYACNVDDKLPDENTKVHPAVEKYRLLERTYYSPRRPKDSFKRWVKGCGLLLANFYKNPLTCLRLLDVSQYGKQAESFKLLYRAIPLLGKGNYDIIHCQFGALGPVGLALRDAGAIQGKLITTFRGSDITKYVRKWGKDIYAQLFAEGDFFLTNCEFFRQRAIQLGCQAEQIVVHGSGIDCTKFAFQPRSLPVDGPVRIASTGRLVEKKGLQYCIRAIAKLAQSYPNIEYNIVGDGSLKEKLQQQIEELNVAHLVKLRGWKQQQELIQLLNNTHIFIAASVTAANGDSDAPVNTLKEAMAMGIPVIGTLHGGIPELVEDGVSGFLVPERNPDAIAEKLSYLIEHPEIWPQITQVARAKVEEKYDTNKLNNELVEIYQQLLSQTGKVEEVKGVEQKKFFALSSK